MAKTCIALRHVAFEDLGVFAPAIVAAGYEVSYREVGVDPIDVTEIVGCDLLVVLGGPIGVYEGHLYPFLADEIAAVAARLRAGKPTLGVCLGHQMIAAALGAKVAPGPGPEIGWGTVELTAIGLKSVLTPIAGLPVLHWHGDVAALPPGAECLARTAICPNQAFAIGRHVLALQFHIEVRPKRIEQWLIGHAVELGKHKIELSRLRADTARLGPPAAQAAKAALGQWLRELPG